jgi:hypothetical protein
VVRVRRESDNTEKDFSGSQIESGEMARWVNEQPTLPLDLRELDTNTGERDGALIEAAAAYSLRKLKEDFTGDVVEVRRNVDGETEGFTADEVTDGTLEGFVNASFDDELPLDQATGAAAAYSLRNLSSSYTGNVVEVRRSSDDTVKSFTASEVADGTLESWVNTDVVTYESDFSAGTGGWFATNATPAIATDPTGTEDVLKVTVDASAGPKWGYINNQLTVGHSYFVQAEVYVPSSNESVDSIVLMDSSGGTATSYLGIQTDEWVTVSTAGTPISKTFNVRAADGTTQTAYTGFQGNGTDVFYIRNVQITQTTADGHVKTWYDQSGSDNHAVQTDTAKQPKIVEGGTLVTGGIDFDGAGQKLVTPTTSVLNIDGAKDKSIFAKGTFPAENFIFLGNIGDFGEAIRYRRKGINARFEVQGGGVTGGSLLGADGAVYSSIFSGTQLSDSDVSSNGSITDGTGTLSINTANTVLDIGYLDGTLSEGAGQLSELIIYDSDQSTKRRAIEENIANHYDISLAAFSRDGTVSTWYDQSGSTPANDATQTDPTKQPKIVVNGNLVADGIDFDGSTTQLDITGFSPVSLTYGAFTVASIDDNTASNLRTIFDSSDSTNGGFAVAYGNTASKLTPFWFDGDDTAANVFSGGNNLTLSKSLYSLVIKTGASTTHVNGSLNETVTNTWTTAGSNTLSKSTIGYDQDTPGRQFNGRLQELIIYDTDQSDNRTAIEANIGETYGITDIPAANDTVNGFVQTWYDQSGNGNDAEQTTASSQPKIVGEVTSGQPHAFLGALVFDGDDDHFALTSNLTTQPFSTFSVYSATQNSSYIYSGGTLPVSGRSSIAKYVVHHGNGLAPATHPSTEILGTYFANSTTSEIFSNGLSVGSGDAGNTANTIRYVFGRPASAFGGTAKELIIYNSDQSSNRPAIEANINNQYDIY